MKRGDKVKILNENAPFCVVGGVYTVWSPDDRGAIILDEVGDTIDLFNGEFEQVAENEPSRSAKTRRRRFD